jgi:hypothetical protein
MSLTPTIPHPAYYYIRVAPDHAQRSAMLFGDICATWRPDGRDYKPGITVFVGCAHVPFGFEARIRTVRNCTAFALSLKELEKIGFSTSVALVEHIQQFYGDRVRICEPAGQYIEWESPSGYFVDYREAYRDNPVNMYKYISPFREDDVRC